MQCYIRPCVNTSQNFSTCGRITFHGFPSEPGFRAAWLRALGIQDSQLLDSAVVCSQHFLHDDICETESGSRQLRTGAVPSTVLVCMTCLDTDSKMSPISQYNLEEAYEKLTGRPLWDGGNLKQTLCVQCAQQLRNFSRFREQSLRARSLMMELLEKHEVITLQHIKIIQDANNKLKNNVVSTKHGPELCDMYIPGNLDEDRQTGSQETVHGVTVKTECSEDPQWEAEDMEMIIEENADCDKEELTIEQLTYEGDLFTCSVCREQFPHEHACSAHARTHLHDARPAAASAHTAETPSGNEARAAESADTTQHSERALVTNSGASDSRAPDSDHTTNTELKSCVVKLYDILKYPQNAKVKVESSPPTLQTASSRDSLYAHTAREDAQHRAASEDEVAATHEEPAASVLSGTEPGTSGHGSRTRTFTCNVCERAFTRKDHLVRHMNSHTGEKPYSCETCTYKCSQKGNLVKHMWIHTGEKSYSCEICSHKCAYKSYLVRHMMTHTGEKPYSCNICGYKCTENSSLVKHMRSHTGEKPYSCDTCSYKSTTKGALVAHMRTHTGEKPYSCKICGYKCTEKSSLVKHMRTHTGEKPYSCETCSYKSATKGPLVAHMRTHTGEKPYSCKVCGYKCKENSSLVKHMRTHTGEKPYSCKICSYKCTENSSLVKHMRSHTGEQPYSCKICSYKCTQNSSLVNHMRTHTGEMPYLCKICSYKSATKGSLVKHMRTHTGEKPYSCKICSYKCTQNSSLVNHMRTHTGEKPYLCKICSYKSATKGSLVKHMRSHTGAH